MYLQRLRNLITGNNSKDGCKQMFKAIYKIKQTMDC